MNRSAAWAMVAGLLTSGWFAAVAAPQDKKIGVPADVVRQVKGAAPKGWTVEVKEDTLHVRRDEPVERGVSLPNAAPNTKPVRTKEQFSFIYHFVPHLDEEGYLKLKADIDRRGRELEKMYEGMRHIRHKFDSFLPSNPVEAKLVEDYEAAKKQLTALRLPDYLGKDFTIHAGDGRWYRHISWFVDQAVEDEVTLVESRVTSLFTRYAHSPRTRDAVTKLKANLSAFELEARFHGDDGVNGKPISVTLSAAPNVPDGGKDWPVVRISEVEAIRLIDHLADAGWFDTAVDLSKARAGEPGGPCYTVRIQGGKEARYHIDLGWNMKMQLKLDHISEATRGRAREAMDRQRISLTEDREAWEKAAKSSADVRPVIRP